MWVSHVTLCCIRGGWTKTVTLCCIRGIRGGCCIRGGWTQPVSYKLFWQKVSASVSPTRITWSSRSRPKCVVEKWLT